MIIRKSQREIDLMRESGKIVGLAHQKVKQYIKPGISTYELDKIVEDEIIKHNAIPSFKGYGGFPAASCICINDEVVHGIPSKNRFLKDGDIVTIDIGAKIHGYHGDSGWSYPVGNISDSAKQLLKVTEESLFKGLSVLKHGVHLSDVSNAIQTHAESYGYGVVRDFIGHGVGVNLHEDPQIPNYGPPGKGPIIKSGMVLAIEPMVNEGSYHVKVLSDNWTAITVDGSLSAQFEHTVVVTDNGYEILTKV